MDGSFDGATLLGSTTIYVYSISNESCDAKQPQASVGVLVVRTHLCWEAKEPITARESSSEGTSRIIKQATLMMQGLSDRRLQLLICCGYWSPLP